MDDCKSDFILRFATERDTKIILQFIKELADFEKMSKDVVATEESLKQSLFEKKCAEVIIGECMSKPIGFVLFFHNFSTFIGKPGIYIEDIYVMPGYRHKGFGGIMLSYMAQLAVERDCARLEWSVLNWNEAAIKFYLKAGAKAMNEWTVFRLSDL